MTSFQLRRAAGLIHAGGVVACPTEAVWGLHCDPWNPAAVQRLLAAKQRAPEKGLILISDDIQEIWPLCGEIPDAVREKLEASWPGPRTWVLPATALVPGWITGGRDSFAARVTAHPVAAALVAKVGYPLVSTSANVSGRSPARTLHQVVRRLGGCIDGWVAGDTGDLAGPTPMFDALTGAPLRI